MLRVPGVRAVAGAVAPLWGDNWRGKQSLKKMKYPDGRRYAEQMAFFDSEERHTLHRSDAPMDWTTGADEFIDNNFLPNGVTRSWDVLSRLQYLDTMVGYLPGDILNKVDIASMKVSLEMRSPLLDHKLAEFMAHVPVQYKLRGRVSKYLLKKIGERLLPSEVLYRPKLGFSLPLPQWFRGELRGYVESMLMGSDADVGKLLNRNAIKTTLHDHMERGIDRTQTIFSLLCLEIWLKNHPSVSIGLERKHTGQAMSLP
jgi:asparagine synthase (glutamine-hydrolysing)